LKQTADTAKPISDRNAVADNYILAVISACIPSSTGDTTDTSDTATATASTSSSSTKKVCTSWLGYSFELVKMLPPCSNNSTDASDEQLYDASDPTLFEMHIWGGRWLCQYTNGTGHSSASGSDTLKAAASSNEHDATAAAAER
jgi:hypothetical protein